MTLHDIQALVVSVDPGARHYESDHRHGQAYTVWWEKRTLPLMADGRHMGGIKFQISRYAKLEGDAIAAALYSALEERPDISFEYLTDYEPETGYIHHIFDCEGI